MAKMRSFCFADTRLRLLVRFTELLYNLAMHPTGLWLSLLVCWGWVMPALMQAQGRTPSAPVGASMALLATLQDAGILPSEGTPTANKIVQIVIQFQGLFMKSTDATVRQFVDEALKAKFGAAAEGIAARFRQAGWTTQVLEAVCDHYAELQADQRALVAGSFARVNMRLEDFILLSDLYTKARSTFGSQGRDIHVIFAEHRRNMPGGQRFDRKERRDGNEGLHTDQGQDRPHQRRFAVTEEAPGSGTGPFL
ncbi:MAG TPA: hypothetical protein VFM24_02970, partial [Nitrospira sp.]|nr:hypothetical protein [Nitrospira sp.]